MVTDKKIIVGLPAWNISGPCIFAERLVRGLRGRGWDAHILVTEENTSLVPHASYAHPRPDDVPFADLPAGPDDDWGLRWEAMIRYLEEQAPCVYIMTHDWRHNVVAPRLSDRVQLVCLIQADSSPEVWQAARLGTWCNAIVAVADPIEFYFVDNHLNLLDRTTTIRNAVPVLQEMPAKAEDGPLKLAYSGELRKDQKRLFDLIEVARLLQQKGVDFELTLIGAGAYRAELEELAAELVGLGRVRFTGGVTNIELLRELESTHIFVLTSQFEGLSISLLEAMSRGCVPVVSRLASQSIVIDEGHNGYTAQVGNTPHFSEIIAGLAADRANLKRVAQNAFQSVRQKGCDTESMLDSYITLFGRMDEMVHNGRFARARNWVSLPPPFIGDMEILRLGGDFEAKYVNGIPVWPNSPPVMDASKLPAEVAAQKRKPVNTGVKLRDARVFFAIPYGQISGVDVFSHHMVRELRARGVDATVLGKRHSDRPMGLSIAEDVPVEEPEFLTEPNTVIRWQKAVEYLTAQAPCVYIPNYDYEYSSIIPMLPDEVRVVSICHSDDPMHYAQIARVGNVSNAVVAVSTAIRHHVASLDPTLEPRLSVIPYGVHPAPERDMAASEGSGRLRILFTGRLTQHQKRVWDLINIAKELDKRGVDFELTIAGEGPDQDYLRQLAKPLLLNRRARFVGKLNHEEVATLLAESHVYLLPSAFEGLSVGLLEAMGASVVPVVSNMRSGVPDVMRNGENGFVIPMGCISQYADALEFLANNKERRWEMAREARRTVAEGGYRVVDMADKYYEVLEKALATPFNRPFGLPVPPPWLRTEITGRDHRRYALEHPLANMKKALDIRMRRIPK